MSDQAHREMAGCANKIVGSVVLMFFIGTILTMALSVASVRWSEWGVAKEHRLTAQIVQDGETERAEIWADNALAIEKERQITTRTTSPTYLAYFSARTMFVVTVLVILFVTLRQIWRPTDGD